MPEPAPAIHLRIDRLAWEEGILFEDLDLSFPAGRWSCLLGPSGCGKTTLLRLVAGLLEGGEARASDGRPLDGRIAYMAQSDLLLPWLTVRENLVLGPRLRGAGRALMRDARERAAELLAQVGLAAYAEALPQTLSGGMRQRAALARTLVEDRPVVLMDEPFSALDTVSRHRLQELAARLLADRTVLLVTHNPLEALRLGHQLFVLGGRPTRVQGPLVPEGAPPRPAGDPAVLRLQGALLDQLVASAALTEAA
ncbi:ABC transporter ATP-binding protein [Marinimicrococcus flavescens]|uniref:ABC transporter ATP-binding protein n=1 Tax=Marinimicrococcus flavescens TaxID=3031815 RepID=A0AAP3XR61_9PROT|nr:ABC transporter ATP-binding protein [Marinimicrococcus flavescens]